MSIGAPELVGIVVAALSAGAVVLWVLRPLLDGPQPLDTLDPRAVALLSRREAALAGLHDLDADHADNRIGDDVYEALRAELVADGAAALAALDRLAESAAGRTEELTARVESDIAARLPGRTEELAARVESDIAARLPGRTEELAARVESDVAARLPDPNVELAARVESDVATGTPVKTDDADRDPAADGSREASS